MMSQDSIREKPARMSPQQTFRRKWLDAECEPQSTRVNPYPGLRSFNVDEAHIFRARVNQIAALRKTFAGASLTGENRHVIMVVGGSSSGKSSIVKAGLLADIHSLKMPDGDGNWYVVESRPVQEPMQELLQGLTLMIVERIFARLKNRATDLSSAVREALDALGIPEVHIPSAPADSRSVVSECVRALLDERLWSTRHQEEPKSMAPALALLVKGPLNNLDLHLYPLRAGPPRLLVSIDQFEEIFRSPIGPERDAIFELIRFADHAQRQGAKELYVVASMRSEELHRCSELQGLSDIVNRSIHLVELVLRDDAELAVVEPGRFALQGYGVFPINREAHWPYTQRAVDAIVDAYAVASDTVEHRADALSLLQHFLRLLWARTVGAWVKSSLDEDALLIDLDALSAIPGWDPPVSSWKASGPAAADVIGEAQHKLGSVLNYRADAVYNTAIQVWCDEARDSSEETKVLARSVLKAAFVSLARRDDQRRVVRDWQTISSMLAVSAEAERFAQPGTTSAPADAALFRTRFEAPLAAALREFERATLIERRPDPAANGLPSSDKYTVYHESFIRNWGQYAGWVREAGKAADTLRSLHEELRTIGHDPSTPDGRKREDIVTAGREADLSPVIGGTDEGAKAQVATTADSSLERDAAKPQRGWASQAWAASEIAQAEKSGLRVDVSNALAEIRDARRLGVIARASRFELEARALKAKLRAANLLRWTMSAFVALVAISGALYFYYQQNTVNWSLSQIKAIGLIGFEATEVTGGINRHISQDRNLWLTLNALETNDALDWPSDSTIAVERERMRTKIGNRARQALADLTYVPDKKMFFENNPLFGTNAVSEREVKCLRRGESVPIKNDKASLSPTSIIYKITEDGTLEYTADTMARPHIVNNVQPGLDPATMVCVAPDATALLVISRRGPQPWVFVVLTHWNKAVVDSKSQWFLQTYPGREILSWSSGALLAGYPIDTKENFTYFRQGSVLGFLVPNKRAPVSASSNPATGGNPALAGGDTGQIGVLWTNEGFSSPTLDPKKLPPDKSKAAVCAIGSRGGQSCRLEVTSEKGETITASYVMFNNGLNKACVADAEYCQVSVKVSKSDEEPIEFSYQGRPPKNLKMDNDYLWIQGDDDIVRSYDRRRQTVKDLLALRWKHLSCKLEADILGNLTRNEAGTKSLPKFYDQKALPDFLDGRDCVNMAPGGKT